MTGPCIRGRRCTYDLDDHSFATTDRALMEDFEMRKKLLGTLLAAMMMVTSAVPAMAYTVYYNGTPVSWDYGRKFGVFSYSAVQSTVFTHSATANTTSSGWKAPGVEAYAQHFVGTGLATAYWNCR